MFSLSSSDVSGLNATLDVFISTESLEKGNGVLSLGNLSNKVVYDEGELGDLKNAMTAGKDQGRNCGGGNSTGQGVSPLTEIYLSVPSSPCVEWEGKTTLTTHVCEGSLSGSSSSGSADSGNTSNGATSSP